MSVVVALAGTSETFPTNHQTEIPCPTMDQLMSNQGYMFVDFTEVLLLSSYHF
jgi:hypothetical protein